MSEELRSNSEPGEECSEATVKSEALIFSVTNPYDNSQYNFCKNCETYHYIDITTIYNEEKSICVTWCNLCENYHTSNGEFKWCGKCWKCVTMLKPHCNKCGEHHCLIRLLYSEPETCNACNEFTSVLKKFCEDIFLCEDCYESFSNEENLI